MTHESFVRFAFGEANKAGRAPCLRGARAIGLPNKEKYNRGKALGYAGLTPGEKRRWRLNGPLWACSTPSRSSRPLACGASAVFRPEAHLKNSQYYDFNR